MIGSQMSGHPRESVGWRILHPWKISDKATNVSKGITYLSEGKIMVKLHENPHGKFQGTTNASEVKTC